MANSLYLKVLKSIKGIISFPLCESINKSFTPSVFPSMCKIAKIVKIVTNKSSLYYNNYRRISILSNIGKIIEKVIHIPLIKFLEENNCFYERMDLFISEKQEKICIN